MATGLGDEKGWWCPSLDDSPDDITGNNSGTYQGGMGTVADTGSGGSRAYGFNGSTQYISGLGQSYWDFMNNSGVFTVSCWAKNDVASPTSQQTLVSTNYDSVTTGWGLYYNTSFGTRFDLTKAVGGVFSAFSSDGVLSGQNVWKNVIVTGDGTNLRMFINGVLADTDAFTGFSGATQANELTIGSYLGAALPYDGRIDDVRIFDRAITQEEIDHLKTSRGIEGGPTTGFYNPFICKRFHNDYTRRIR